jgi:hypothetical protein
MQIGSVSPACRSGYEYGNEANIAEQMCADPEPGGLISSQAITAVTFNTEGQHYQSLARSEPGFPLIDFRLVLASDIEHLPALFWLRAVEGEAHVAINRR